ncbi:MAG: conjugal transfer protein TraR [Deltaproteobacteria bacterium RIFCSPLOWO2_02_FULL_44_10]|nr:MAG: conjugal transfer protein TraR [Deltaproteobacteria bacterium RIFCSPHIGHO2_02_FULL_44_16]OGQ45030.1 MAG: conjugal transfer protein TraR [Deltaproteobacteria bacterium RIFCSPLOWO2_02_FULL_44_10]
MKKRDIDRFKKILDERRKELVQTADLTREAGLGVEQADLPDEVDLAATEADQSMNLRLRDRELVLLKKIDKAIQKIELGTYGVCERCEEEIDVKRLEARPVAEMCIRCKEELERVERGYAE